ncbi:bifunctional adenosylcobinamide kinase/adenosylcobinamide-phosphate guanylyltransferase [Marinobacter lacisalsi]|uniref:Bifunctional adenosylcobalamin biosynthesis protein n=1 Tax=Marinobacter lacisalsi TaxID=475979 RepID=A0ABV8QLX8_9GAMM
MSNRDTKTLVLGGVRSGKSSLAEQLAVEVAGPVVYLATATAGDDEMARRIARHQDQRPSDWGLVEEPVDLAAVLSAKGAQSPAPCLLVDCMSLWVSNLLHIAQSRFSEHRQGFLDALVDYPGEVIIVSNEVGLGIIGMDPLTRRFADELGWLNQALASRCDRVLMSVAGLQLTLK